LLALIIAGYTAYIERQQVRAQVWPYLQLGKSNADGHYEFSAINRGVGPVVVKSVELLADGKRIPDWQALLDLFDFEPTGKHITSTLSGNVLAPGDHLHWIAFDNKRDVNTFIADWTRFHVEARVCYASTLGESWLTVYRPGWPGGFRPRPVDACPAVPEPARFSD
ncbi:MAG: hypothetical protein ACRETC_12520, partial [Gammaproteobacteria bacterium]